MIISKINNLTLNKDKTVKYMMISWRQRLSNIETDPIIELGEVEIRQVNLGIIIDDQLLWKKQVEVTIPKVCKGIGMLHEMS